jgi:hypothetical protein
VKADGFQFTVAKHGKDGWDVTAVPLFQGKPIKPKDRLQAAGRVGWFSSNCFTSDGAPRPYRGWGGAAIDPADYLHTLSWISAGDCAARGLTRKNVLFSSCDAGKAYEIQLPSGTVLPAPVGVCQFPLAPPPPPPAGAAAWKESDDADRCPQGDIDGRYRESVDGARKQAQDAGAIRFPWTAGEKALYLALVPFLEQWGLDAAMYGEELAVQRGEGFSENYDLLISDGGLRYGAGSFRSTCRPATRSEVLVPSVGPILPALGRVDVIRIKLANNPDFADATALRECAPGEPACTYGGITRRFIPTCGTEDVPAEERIACSDALAVSSGLRWEGGGRPHPSNPWLWRHEGRRVRACAGTVCSDWVN